MNRDIHTRTPNSYANENPLLLVPEIPNNSPIIRPNLLPISTNSGELSVAQLLETLHSPLSSPIEKEWASQLVSLGMGIDTGIVDESTFLEKGTDLRQYFILKREIYTDPAFLLLCRKNDPDIQSIVEILVALLRCSPLNSSSML